MTTEGEGYKTADRRGSLGYLIQQASKLYGTKDFNPKLSFEEFDSKVKFTYGVPLIVLDIVDQLTGSTFLSDHYKHVFPKKLIERFDPHCDQFLESKG